MKLENQVTLMPVVVVAKNCEVDERTITRWIREDRLPAKKFSTKWMVRSDILKVFIANGFKMPADFVVDNKSDSQLDYSAKVDLKEKIQFFTFESLDTGRAGWTLPKACKFPNELYPRAMALMEKVPQFKRSLSNLMRDSLYKNIEILEAAAEGGESCFDPKWKIWNAAERRIQNRKDNERILEHMLNAAKGARHSNRKKDWDAFVEEFEPLLEGLTGRWRGYAEQILSGKLLKKSKKQTDADDAEKVSIFE